MKRKKNTAPGFQKENSRGRLRPWAVAVWLLVRPNKYENVNEVSVDTRKLIRSKS